MPTVRRDGHYSSKGWQRNLRQGYFVEGAEPVKAKDSKDGTGLEDYMVRRADRSRWKKTERHREARLILRTR